LCQTIKAHSVGRAESAGLRSSAGPVDVVGHGHHQYLEFPGHGFSLLPPLAEAVQTIKVALRRDASHQ